MIKSFMNKQKKLISFAFAAALAIFAITGCKGTFSETKPNNNSDVSKVSFMLTAGGAARTAIPDYKWGDYVYDLQMITGYDSANPDKGELVTAVEKKAFSHFESGQMPLPKGICYKFVLTGYLADNQDKKTIIGETVVTLTEDNQTIPFKMYPATDGLGKVVMYIYFPDDGVITSAKADISEARDTKPNTVRYIYDHEEKANTKYVMFETDYEVPSGKIQYVNINLFDSNGALVFDYAESAYVVNGATSFSQFTLTAADYYRKKVSITIKKNGETWNGSPEKLILTDNSSDPAKVYEITGVDGEYTGYLPKGDVDYEVYIKGTNGNNDINTGITVNPTKDGGIASGEVISVKLPSEDGLSFNPSGSPDSGIISSTTDWFGNSEIIVPKDQDFKVEVSVKDGYEVPDPAKITIGGNDYTLDENGKTEVTYNSDGSETDLPSNVQNWNPVTIVYTYKYDFEWQESAMAEYTFPLESEHYTYTVKDKVPLIMGDATNKYFDNIVHPDGTSIKGWYIKSIDGVDTNSDTIITEIPKGTTGNLVIVPAIRSSNEVSYTVNIIVENIENDDYAQVWSFTSYGEKNTEVTATVHGEWLENYDVEAEKGTLNEDGSTVLVTKYTRKRYKITLDPNGGKWSDNATANKELEIKFEAPISTELPVLENYEIIGWKDSSDNFIEKLPDQVLKEEKYTAQYKQVSAQYKIITKKETVNGGYEETSVTKTGKLGAQVTANVNTIEGFKDPVIVGATVTADGNAEVIVTYNRKDITLTFDPTTTASWSDSTKGNKTVSGKYGADVTIPADPVRTDYNFAGWSPDVPEKFPATNIIYTATWEQVSANYSIQVLEENTKGGFDIIADKSRTAKYEIGKTPTEAEVLAGLEDIPGFTKSVERKPVTQDGKAVQTVKYVRNTITYTFKLYGGKVNESTEDIVLTGKYGTAVATPENPVKENFKFAGWNNHTDSDTVFGLENKVFSAIWLSEISGNGDNPWSKDIVLVVSGNSTITATVQLPYESEWDIVWTVDGQVLSEKGTSITIANAKDKVYKIFVEVTDKASGGSITLSREVEYNIKNEQ